MDVDAGTARIDNGHGVEQLLQQGAHQLSAGDLCAAAKLFEAAHRKNSRHAVVLNCLGIVYRRQSKFNDSLKMLRTALEVRPDFAEAHSNLANTLGELGQSAQAIQHLRRALELKPGLAEGHNNLGVLLLADGDAKSAIAHFQAALRVNPQFVDALNNLGNALREVDQLEHAGRCFRAALQLAPAAELHNNLGNVLRDLGDHTAARFHYEQALDQKPTFAEVADNLGTLLVDMDDFDGAIAAYSRTVQLQPDSVNSHLNLGNALRQQGRLDEARQVYARAAELEPQNHLHKLRLAGLCPAVFASHAQMADYRRQLSETWEAAHAGTLASDSILKTRLAEPPFALQFMDGNLRGLKEAYARIFSSRFPQYEPERHTGRPRIGIVVTRTHEGIFLRSMKGVLRGLPAELADITIVCPRSSVTFLKDALGDCVQFATLPQSFSHVVDRVRSAAFDVLYYWEIGTDVTNYFLPFLRLAPVQCTSWGVQVTTGIENIDYYLSSKLVEPDSADEHYSERLLLSDTLLTYQHTHPLPNPLVDRHDLGLPAESNLYVCAQQLGKFHPDFDSTLREILLRDRSGALVVIEDAQKSAGKVLRTRLSSSLAEVFERVFFVPRQNRQGYVSLLKAANVLLDPPHFVGVNTTYDSLMFGKPIVTRPSEYHRGRYTYGCYRKIGYEQCVVRTADEYVKLAVEIGSNPQKQRQVETELSNAVPALFHDQRAVDEHERLFAQLIELARSR